MFNSSVKKIFNAAMKKEMVICNVAGEYVYVSDGRVVYKLTPEEYRKYILPVTLLEAGDYSTGKSGRAGNVPNIAKIFEDAVNAVQSLDAMEPAPFSHQANKKSLKPLYNPKGFPVFCDISYLSVMDGDIIYKALSAKSPVICFSGDDALALILPVYVQDPRLARAVAAYFKGSDPVPDAALQSRIAELEERLLTAKSLYQEAREALDLQKATPANPAIENPIEGILSRLGSMEGLLVTVKGAQTASPVIWLSGNVEQHKETIQSIGARYSTKKAAWYIKAA